MTETKHVVPHSQDADAPLFALPQAYFTSQEWHARDLERVFMKRWLFAGHASQIPSAGDFFTFEIEKENVVIARGNDGQINAFHNSCRHRGSRICKATSGNAKGFICPNHAWSYGLDGSLKIAPRMTGLDKAAHSAVPVWIEVWHGMIFLNFLSEKPRPVSEYLGATSLDRYALGQTRVVHDEVYELDANWKLAAETYNECYHCGHTHPALCALIDPLKDLEAWDDADSGDDFAIYTDDLRDAIIKEGTRTFSMDGSLECKTPLGSDGLWHDEIAALSWYPQFGIFVYPDHAVTYSWLPVAPSKTLFRSTWLVHQDAIEGTDFVSENLVAFGHLTNVEDKEICENAQRGIESSGYRPGPYHPIFEGPLRGFNRFYQKQVDTDPAKGA